MQPSPASNPERIAIGGIKLSGELAQFSFRRSDHRQCVSSLVLAAIAKHHINIPFLSFTVSSHTVDTTFCVASEHLVTVKSILEAETGEPESITCLPSVCTLTLYPHRSNLSLMSRIIGVFASHSLPIYGICTSVSALSINTRYTDVEQAVKRLQEVVELPANHSPLRHQFQVQQLDR